MIDPRGLGRLRGFLASLLIPALFVALPFFPEPLTPDFQFSAGLASLQAQKIRSILEFLASAHFKGRGTGTPESHLTASYVASLFQHWGLVPLATQCSSYIQEFELTQALPANESFLRIEPSGSAESPPKLRDDYVPAPWGRDGEVTGRELVFAGYGVRAPDLQYDDYAGIEVQGRVVVVLSKMPPTGKNGLPNHLTRADYEDPLEKTRLAQSLGAAGLVLVLQPADELPSIRETNINKAPIYLSQDVRSINIPCMVVASRTGELLIGSDTPGPGEDLTSIQKSIDAQRSPRSFLLHRKVTVKTSYQRRDFSGYNVVGKVPGTNPELRDQAVIISAHYDHLGVGENQEIFYGADDDASGTTGVLELAEAFQKNPAKPPRSVLFAAWGAEEVGLLGSKYYIAHPLFPLKQTIAQIQLDMIGRDEDRKGSPDKGIPEEKPEANLNSVTVNGAPFSHDLRKALESSNREIGLELKFRYDFGEDNLIKRSDHWPFLKSGIPSILLFTGFHPDYHKTTDTSDKIDYPKMERILKLVYRTVWDLAGQTASPDYSDEPFREDKP